MTTDPPSDPRLSGLTVHELQVTLLDVLPLVWRRLRVPSALPLSAVHTVLQLAMGWEDRHLHEWRVGDTTYGLSDEDSWGEDLADESAALLGDVAPEGAALHYDYDLSEGWEHLVEVAAVSPWRAEVPPVVLLAGARACPPEDCGGPLGYEHLLDALGDPDDAEHEATVRWLGDHFDPEELDVAQVNRRLAELWQTI